jgi:hypothetical protein
VRKTCEQCGEDFDAESSRARFCGSTCRGRAHRGESSPVVRVVEPRPGVERRSVRDAVDQALDAAGLLGEWQAAQALDMASAIDGGGASGSALAALHRELRAVMSDVLRGVNDPASRVGGMRDELAARRERRGGGVGA